jgi:hypothetical protein
MQILRSLLKENDLGGKRVNEESREFLNIVIHDMFHKKKYSWSNDTFN